MERRRRPGTENVDIRPEFDFVTGDLSFISLSHVLPAARSVAAEGADFVLLVNPQKVPARNVKDFVEWSQQQKGLFLATFGAGTPGHFGAFMFGDAVKLKPEAVHYKNTSDALGGLFSGLASTGLYELFRNLIDKGGNGNA